MRHNDILHIIFNPPSLKNTIFLIQNLKTGSVFPTEEIFQRTILYNTARMLKNKFRNS